MSFCGDVYDPPPLLPEQKGGADNRPRRLEGGHISRDRSSWRLDNVLTQSRERGGEGGAFTGVRTGPPTPTPTPEGEQAQVFPRHPGLLQDPSAAPGPPTASWQRFREQPRLQRGGENRRKTRPSSSSTHTTPPHQKTPKKTQRSLLQMNLNLVLSLQVRRVAPQRLILADAGAVCSSEHLPTEQIPQRPGGGGPRLPPEFQFPSLSDGY